MLEYDLRTFLTQKTSMIALIGEDVTTPRERARFYPVRLPQDPEYPCVVYARTSTSRDYHTGGPSGLAKARISFQILGADVDDEDGYDKAKDVFEVIRKSLDGFRGPLNGAGSTIVQLAKVEGERDDYAEEVNAYRVSCEAEITYEEATGL